MRALELQAMEIAGVITGLREQPRIELEPGIFYKPDFAYREGTRRIHEDVKGFVTPRWRLIRKLWALHGPTTLRVTRVIRGRTHVVEEILPRG